MGGDFDAMTHAHIEILELKGKIEQLRTENSQLKESCRIRDVFICHAKEELREIRERSRKNENCILDATRIQALEKIKSLRKQLDEERQQLRTENETISSQSRYIREHIKQCNTEIELLYKQRDNHISVLRHINASSNSNSKDECSE